MADGDAIAATAEPTLAKSRRRRTGKSGRSRHFDILLDVARRISGTESLDQVLYALVEMTSNEVGCDRSTFFLYDSNTNDLFSRIAQGLRSREIRISANEGIAGAVYRSGEPIIVDDAVQDPRFDSIVDKQTGYTTRNLVCVPLTTVGGEIVGVAQCLNKESGQFTERDINLLSEVGQVAVPALRSSHYIERMALAREQEMQFLNVVTDITSEIDLDVLLHRIMVEVTRILGAERSTLFLNDEKTNELFSRVAQGEAAPGEKVNEIRLPNNVGIAGAVFSSGKTVNIPHAYADLRFNPAFDRVTGFFTRSILSTPLTNKSGKVIGVTQALNKVGGPFTQDDESRLKAFTAEVAIALENAKLFNDVQKMKNYNDSMLLSMADGVITLNNDRIIVTCNSAGLRIFQCTTADIIDKKIDEFFIGKNSWIVERLAKVESEQHSDVEMDVEIEVDGKPTAVNLSILPLKTEAEQQLGTMMMIEDISIEKRVKATMARYMDPTIAAQMFESADTDVLGGISRRATILFSDIRGFTTLTEHLGATGTVAFLNEYFGMMVDVITKYEGMLDKFIGDAIMAAFGLPISHDDDEDRAVQSAIAMIRECRRWSAERVRANQLPVDMGIGLNTDMIVSGNIGSAKRMDYTLIGDGVNVASRLESACKAYSARILISDNTYKLLRGTYRIRDVDQVIVKGKTEPVGVYEVLDYHTEETFPHMMDVVNYFNEGIAYYRKRNFEKSIQQFEETLRRHPADKLSQTYIDRCRFLIENPPPDDWHGIWEMHEK
jgi:adenylate cyclase